VREANIGVVSDFINIFRYKLTIEALDVARKLFLDPVHLIVSLGVIKPPTMLGRTLMLLVGKIGERGI